MIQDGITTETSTSQLETESLIISLLAESNSPILQKPLHFTYLTRLLSTTLPSGYTGLDASRPWLIYWTSHSMSLFGGELDQAGKSRVVETLRSCQNRDTGGFGGGPGQISHLAPSYAAVCALAYVGEEGWNVIDRQGMYKFILSMKQADGSFIMHQGGEVDVRGCYCALSVATLLNLLTPTLSANTSSFIAACQTYEGGLAAASHPFQDDRQSTPALGEAHGGYAFCAAASWSMLRMFSDPTSSCYVPASPSSNSQMTTSKRKSELNVKSLLRWAASVQAMPIEGGGFRGRTNKLVDGCYGWWCGGLFSIIDGLLNEGKEASSHPDLYDRIALQEYVLLLAQAPGGGLRDKPGKPADAYHTSCNLSGLSSAQSKMIQSHSTIQLLRESWISPFRSSGGASGGEGKIVEVEREVESVTDAFETDDAASERMKEIWARTLGWERYGEQLLVGGEENELNPTHPVLNITTKHCAAMICHFYQQEIPTSYLVD